MENVFSTTNRRCKISRSFTETAIAEVSNDNPRQSKATKKHAEMDWDALLSAADATNERAREALAGGRPAS